MSGPRSQSERDALTVEIVFALVTAGLLAAVLYVAVASPALFGDLGRAQETVWRGAAFAVAAVGFTARLLRVLWLFSQQRR
ncbi:MULTISPECIES: DUF6332 family protein [Streptomyces]|uniref:Uncharacterized protein n=2 Tax=Streptomyces TaxID=1883 RepID=A0ABT9KU37_9ACTN|nr:MULTISPECIES: DUF6332 family protein [Streptomyces]MBW8088209.1 hypothetical protein [Streptomyces hygroscopicus subsp. hygroscopicus]MCO8303377.1 DUF6332 family protein [Streptomyces sp. RKCA744]MDN3054572.1 DUF6332 family protein [Streptomyces sp. SRF1]MDP9611645.1 hypothetical protein [Streptomyces demainii]GHJ25796.1 hypothetical protein TPA0910_02290 [Streptomyces hygroscopicus]